MIKVVATLYVDEEQLLTMFKSTNPNTHTDFEGAFASEMSWVNESGIVLDSFQVSK